MTAKKMSKIRQLVQHNDDVRDKEGMEGDQKDAGVQMLHYWGILWDLKEAQCVRLEELDCHVVRQAQIFR